MVKVPNWISEDITPCDIAGILQGGCASGAWMDAVDYAKANEIMDEHGTEVLEFLEERFNKIPRIPNDTIWFNVASFFLVIAVEAWAWDNARIADWENDEPVNKI